MSSDLLLRETLRLITVGLCFFIAIQFGRRHLANDEDRLAWNAFRLWWVGLGTSTFTGAFNIIFPLLGIRVLAPYLGISLINILVVCIALWGLLFYLLYLYTGKAGLAKALGVAYFLFFLLVTAYVFWLQPFGIRVENGIASLQYSRQSNPVYVLILALLVVGPQFIASLMYFTLYFRLKERDQRYRVLLVSASIFMWTSSIFVARALSLNSLDWWPIANRVIILLASLTIYWAYYPPRFVQKRLQVAPI